MTASQNVTHGNPSRSFTLACPAGKKVVGGGYTSADPAVNLTTTANGPSADGLNWLVTVTKLADDNNVSSIAAYAICMTAS